MSEHYNALLADRTARALGLEWERRERGRDRNPAWEIAGVPYALVEQFSTRARDIEAEKDRLIAAYRRVHGRQPTTETVIKLRQQATLATRPDKTVKPLSELTAEWRDQAATLLGQDATAWARTLTGRQTGSHADHSVGGRVLWRAADVNHEQLIDTAAAVVAAVAEKRSTWRRWNLYAEASRQMMGWRFASAQDREAVTAAVDTTRTRQHAGGVSSVRWVVDVPT